jgi:hypothetical protein
VSIDIEALNKYIGERETDVDYVTAPAVHRLGTTLDRGEPSADGKKGKLWAMDADGVLAMVAEVEFQ